MATAAGFAWRAHGDGSVAVTHEGRPAVTLRGDAARRLLAALEGAGEQQVQQLLARVTGNFRRGNERHARRHPRNIVR